MFSVKSRLSTEGTWESKIFTLHWIVCRTYREWIGKMENVRRDLASLKNLLIKNLKVGEENQNLACFCRILFPYWRDKALVNVIPVTMHYLFFSVSRNDMTFNFCLFFVFCENWVMDFLDPSLPSKKSEAIRLCIDTCAC